MLNRVAIGLILLLPAVATAQTADEKLAFAEQLFLNGEDAFALLEYKRFCYHHSDHPQAQEAGLRVARLYLGALNDIKRARDTLAQLSIESARTLEVFISDYSDASGQPLSLFIAAQLALERNDAEASVKKYVKLVEQYPHAELADDALYHLGTVQLHQLQQPGEAAATFERILREYPQSPFNAYAAYSRALALENRDGADAAAIERYQQVAKLYPDTEIGKLAATRAEEIQQTADAPIRQFNQADAVQYTVKRDGYLKYRNRYEVSIELGQVPGDNVLRATLEAALLEHYNKRRDKDDSVRIEAFVTYPLTKAGKVDWTKGQPAQYEIEKRETEDVVKDVLIDILRSR